MTRRVLVLSYYFPPMGGTGVQRVSNFVKYLPQSGWRPTVLTAHPRGYFLFDDRLAQDLKQADVEVVRTASADPTRLFGRGKQVAPPDERHRSWLAALSQFVFIPDNKIGWLPPACYQGMKLLRDRTYDAILSTAPPYTSHLVGALLSRWTGVPLVTDFRDDWVGNPRHTYPTPLHRALHECLETGVLRRSSRVLGTNDRLTGSLQARSRLGADRFTALPHAFDPEDFAGQVEPEARDRMTLVYAGTFYDAQTPAPLLQAMAALPAQLRQSMEAVFVGLLPEREKARIRRLGLSNCTRHVGFVPHEDAMQYLCKADALWMIVGDKPGAETILLGKLPHYLAARKPILGLAPQGATRDALSKCDYTIVLEPDDVEGIRQVLVKWIQAWREEALPVPEEENATAYSAKRVTSCLAEELSLCTEAQDSRTPIP